MEYLIGAIGSIFFIAVLSGVYLLGRGKRVAPPVISDEEKERLEKLQKGFTDLLNYDIEVYFNRKRG